MNPILATYQVRILLQSGDTREDTVTVGPRFTVDKTGAVIAVEIGGWDSEENIFQALKWKYLNGDLVWDEDTDGKDLAEIENITLVRDDGSEVTLYDAENPRKE
jgi:hypothetical protein